MDADGLPQPETSVLLLQMQLMGNYINSPSPPPLPRHVTGLWTLLDQHMQRKMIWGGRDPVFSASTRTWPRIIALGCALRLSALLCTTTLNRLLAWLMGTSPPIEEKVNLYLIVTLPFNRGSFHLFFIHSASFFADSQMQVSFKHSSFILKQKQTNTGNK